MEKKLFKLKNSHLEPLHIEEIVPLFIMKNIFRSPYILSLAGPVLLRDPEKGKSRVG